MAKIRTIQLNVRIKTVKFLEEKVENLYDLELGRVLTYDTMKEKKKKLNFSQLKMFAVPKIPLKK